MRESGGCGAIGPIFGKVRFGCSGIHWVNGVFEHDDSYRVAKHCFCQRFWNEVRIAVRAQAPAAQRDIRPATAIGSGGRVQSVNRGILFERLPEPRSPFEMDLPRFTALSLLNNN
jgi:hypothetical protein